MFWIQFILFHVFSFKYLRMRVRLVLWVAGGGFANMDMCCKIYRRELVSFQIYGHRVESKTRIAINNFWLILSENYHLRLDGSLDSWKIEWRLLSSAQLRIELKFEENRSLMFWRDRVGVRTELWGTPAFIG